MARSASKKSKLYIKIFWGGADLGSVTRRIGTIGTITAGRGLFADIKSTIWPLRDDITILERDRGQIYLNPDLPWDGVVQTGSDTFVLDSRKRTRRLIEIRSNTTASLRLEDISIAIRAGLDHVVHKGRSSPNQKYTPRLMGLLADSTFERNGLISAFVAASIVMIAFAAGLNRREVWHPESIADVDDALKIPFIAPTHFETAPAVLQDRLDRFDYVGSINSYYNDLATLLTNPNALPKNSALFSESIHQYQEQFAEQKDNLSQMKAAGSRLANDVKKTGGQIIGIPTVIGESLDGSLQRILNKVALIQESAKEITTDRSITGDQFAKEPAYDYGAQPKSDAPDALSDFTKKLGAGFRNALPDEEQQAHESKGFAVDATAAQVALFGKDYLKRTVHDCCPGIAGLKAGASPIDLENSENFDRSDEFLAALKASTWGAPETEEKAPRRIVEPLAGTIDPKAVEKAIAGGRFQLQLCFELALRRNQAAKGNMEWRWQIDSRGQMSGLSLLSSTLKDEELIHCVKSRIAGWKFPKPKGGSVEIRYPFEFERDKG